MYDRDMDDLGDDDRGRGRGGRFGGGAGGPGGGRFGPRRNKICNFCSDKVKVIPYKDVDLLRRYLTDRGKIRPRRQTGTCAKHQRGLALAVKRARHLALLPFTADHLRGGSGE
ncbi:MAG: 30S ribosomal protein S18 [Chloroflexota bacterium]